MTLPQITSHASADSPPVIIAAMGVPIHAVTVARVAVHHVPAHVPAAVPRAPVAPVVATILVRADVRHRVLAVQVLVQAPALLLADSLVHAVAPVAVVVKIRRRYGSFA